MCLALTIKKLKFWRAPLGETPIAEPPIFGTVTLFLITIHIENLIHLVVAV